MLVTLKKTHRKDALQLFKLVQMYMQDRSAKNKDPIQVALTVVITAWSNTPLRDELYLQLCKQTTGNSNMSVPDILVYCPVSREVATLPVTSP